MARKKKEPIVIQKTELIPTTIGTINTKENGPWVVIIIIILLLVGIFFIDDITEFIKNPSLDYFTSQNTPSSDSPLTPTNPNEEPEEKIEYYELKSDLIVEKDGFQFSNFDYQENKATLAFKITRKDAEENYFVQNNYFIEIYSNSNTLLARMKIPNQTINITKSLNFNIESALKNGKPAKIAFVIKEEKDYPQVTLHQNNNNTYSMTCNIDDLKVTYYFEKQNTNYPLVAFEENIEYTSSIEDFEKIVRDYTTLEEELQNQEGIDVELTTTTNRLRYQVFVDLKVVSNQVYRQHFNKTSNYALNTEAKVISFELESSGYACE